MTDPIPPERAEAWAEWHAVFAPWCDWRRCQRHDIRLNGPDLVNGRPDGPLAEVAGLSASADSAWYVCDICGGDHYSFQCPGTKRHSAPAHPEGTALVDQLLERAGPASGRR